MKTEISNKIGWALGFDAAANWEFIPINERVDGRPITRELKPGDPLYKDPFKAYDEFMGREI